MTSKSHRPARARRLLSAPLVLVLFLLAACADDKPLNTFEPRGPKAESIHNLMLWIWPIMGIVFVLVVGGAIRFAIKYRVKPEDFDPEDLPTQIHGNTRLELTWTIVPAILLAVIAVPTVAGIWELEKRNDSPDSIEVLVIGNQWWWEYRYDVNGNGFFVDANGDGTIDEHDLRWPLEYVLDPDDVVTANELVIPAGEQVDLLITSRDVIHSFWIPRLNGKRDAVPGRWHTWSIEANEPGKYTGWCTEFCGLSHARMRMSTIALPRDEFDAWLADQAEPAEIPTDEVALAGREIFANQCMSCHVIKEDPLDANGDPNPDAFMYGENFRAPLTAGAAPDLTHFATRSVFAGAIFGTYVGPGTDPDDDTLDVTDYLRLPELAAQATTPDDYRWNAATLKRWVANAPAMKDMAPDDQRGMLAFPQLTDEQLDQVVAYLATLD